MSGHFRRASLLTLILGWAGVGLWYAHAAAPPAAKESPERHEQPTHNSARRVDTTLRDKLDKPTNFKGNDDPKLTCIEFLNFLSERYDVSFEVNDRAFEEDGISEVLKSEITKNEPLAPMSDTTLRQILTKVLTRLEPKSRATFLIRKDAIEITTEAAVRGELGLPVPKLDDEAKNALPLTPILWEAINDEPLADVLHRVADAEDVTILVDPRVKAKAATKIDATLRNVPREVALTFLCDMADLAVVKRSSAYYVTSPQNAERLRVASKSNR
jgi:hypothetical protein